MKFKASYIFTWYGSLATKNGGYIQGLSECCLDIDTAGCLVEKRKEGLYERFPYEETGYLWWKKKSDKRSSNYHEVDVLRVYTGCGSYREYVADILEGDPRFVP